MATYFLAQVVGWYLIIFGVFILAKYEHVRSVAAEVMGHRGQFFIVAVITLILGLLMVVSHNIWIMAWPVIITVFAWLVLIGGLFRLFYPEKVYQMSMSLFNHKVGLQITSVVMLLLGLFLLSQAYGFYHWYE